MSKDKVDYDSSLFDKKVAKIAYDVLGELKTAGTKFEGIVDQLEKVWTTQRGKNRISDLRSTKANEFDSLISTVSNQEQSLASVSKDLYNIDQI